MKLIRKILEYLRGEPQHLNKLLNRGLKIGKNFLLVGMGMQALELICLNPIIMW